LHQSLIPVSQALRKEEAYENVIHAAYEHMEKFLKQSEESFLNMPYAALNKMIFDIERIRLNPPAEEPVPVEEEKVEEPLEETAEVPAEQPQEEEPIKEQVKEEAQENTPKPFRNNRGRRGNYRGKKPFYPRNERSNDENVDQSNEKGEGEFVKPRYRKNDGEGFKRRNRGGFNGNRQRGPREAREKTEVQAQ
jgi:outer membrane biosynthesis protein TonB